MSTETSPLSREFSSVLGHVLRAPLRGRTYRNLCYLGLLLPRGIAYFVLLTVGFSTGVPLAVVFVGLPILLALLAVVVALAGFERRLAGALLGVEIPSPPAETDVNRWTRIKRLLTSVRTWTAVAYLLSVFAAGNVAVWAVASLLGTAGSFLLAPFYYDRAPVVAYGTIPNADVTLDLMFGWDGLLVGLTTTVELGSWQIQTLPGALLVAGVGALVLLLTLQLVNAFAVAWGRYAKLMLTTPRYW